MDMNQELTVADIGWSYENTGIYSLMLFLKRGWGSGAVCLHRGVLPLSPPVVLCFGDWEPRVLVLWAEVCAPGLCAAVFSQNSFQTPQGRAMTLVLQSRCAPCSGLLC